MSNTKTILLGALLASTASMSAEIIISTTRPNTATNAPGITVPSPDSVPATQQPQVLQLLNGDVLQGTFVGFQTGVGVKWRHSAVSKDIEFSPAAVGAVRLNNVTPPPAGSKQTCTVKLINGDEFVGDLLELDAEKLTLDTWYGGTLTIPRKSLLKLMPGVGKSTSIYEGPTDIKGWMSQGGNAIRGNVLEKLIINRRPMVVGGAPAQPGWTFNNDSFIASGAGAQIGRKLKYTDMVNVEFDLAWRGYFQVSAHIFADALEQYSGNAYAVGVNPHNVHLLRMTAQNGQSNIGNANVQSLQQKNAARFSIRINKTAKSIALLVDDVLVQQWKDNQDFAGKGDFLMFSSQGQGIVKLSNIRVTEWDGKMPVISSTTGALKEDLARMVNNDTVSGSLKSIKDGKVQFATSFAADLSIPIDRLTQVD
ncbi:MAG: hypothetical protein EXS24_06070, partial [Pedosphaera sp.]|nr:hypothetical protein [Pedosphaera sp.]